MTDSAKLIETALQFARAHDKNGEPCTAATLRQAANAIGALVAECKALESRQRVLLDFVRSIAVIPNPRRRPEDDIDALYRNEDIFMEVIDQARSLVGDAP